VSPYVGTAAGPLHHKLVAALAAPGAVVTGGHQEGDACFVRKNQEKNMKQVILSEGNNGIGKLLSEKYHATWSHGKNNSVRR
jgi:hypothetical protein